MGESGRYAKTVNHGDGVRSGELVVTVWVTDSVTVRVVIGSALALQLEIKTMNKSSDSRTFAIFGGLRGEPISPYGARAMADKVVA
jgi:hypothetical protein